MDFLAHYGLFLAEAVTVVVAIIVVFAALVGLASKSKHKAKESLCVTPLNEKYEEIAEKIRDKVFNKQELKAFAKAEKKQKKQTGQKPANRKKLYVLDFQGDIRASAVKNLREEITALLTIVTANDEVLVRLESAGGMVHAYGLAASQLRRIRQQNIPLTVVIDKMAASGGYMMACVANKILAAPFAVVGSIGVIAQLPNFNRWLRKNDIEFEQIMAGEYKRTLTMFGENTKKGRQKFQEEVDHTHELFKTFVIQNRPQVDIGRVATGEHWFGQQAIELALVDKLITSDDYLFEASKNADVFLLHYRSKKGLLEKLSGGAQGAYQALLQGIKN